jgi:hypothetical protein
MTFRSDFYFKMFFSDPDPDFFINRDFHANPGPGPDPGMPTPTPLQWVRVEMYIGTKHPMGQNVHRI